MRSASTSRFVITHAGQFYGSRSPIPWFQALAHVAEHTPKLRQRLRMTLIGDDAYNGRGLADWAESLGVGEMVDVAGQLNHADTLTRLAGSNALMLCGASGPGSDLQVPNKLFEYLALRKPIIATCCATSPVVAILRAAKAVVLLRHPDDATGLADAMFRFATKRTTVRRDAWTGVPQFERAHRADELAALFAQVTGVEWPTTDILKEKSALRQPGLLPAVAPTATINASADAGSTTARHTSA